jgi:hypothetical protein
MIWTITNLEHPPNRKYRQKIKFSQLIIQDSKCQKASLGEKAQTNKHGDS